MALTNNGTVNNIKESLIPSGYTLPTVTTFDAEYNRKYTLNVPKASVEDADPATTLQNIIENATVGINKQISDIITADFNVAAETVEVYSELNSITTNVKDGGADFFTNAAFNYVCEVVARIRTV